MALPRWHRTLALRLAIFLNTAIAVVLASFWGVDYARERAIHVQDAVRRLAEEAKVIRVTQMALADISAFQAYLDQFCHQMDLHSSPGHHIILLDRSGKIVARAHIRDEAALEAEMLEAASNGLKRFEYRGDEFVVVGMQSPEKDTIVITQSMAPVYAIIRAQALSRATSFAVLSVTIFLVTTALIWRWVRRPIRVLVGCTDSVRRGLLTTRAEPDGPPEIRFLADGFNAMIATLDRHERAREQELERARHIQRGLLPSDAIAIPGTRIAFQYRPAEKIGGDFLDVFQCEDSRWLIAIADVCGHGIAAALLATLMKTSMRHHGRVAHGPDDILSAVNSDLYALSLPADFATCFIALYDAGTGQVTYANAGHPPGIVFSSDGSEIARLESTAPLLGVFPEATFQSRRISLRPGERLLLYTDGLIEGLDASGRQYGDQRLVSCISGLASIDPTDQLVQLIQDARRFTGKDAADDDVTLFMLQREESTPLA